MTDQDQPTAVWTVGLPPRDGRKYHVRQRGKTAGGHLYTVQDDYGAFWVGDALCRRSNFHGELVILVLMNEWLVENDN